MAPRMVTLRLTNPRMGTSDGNGQLIRAVQSKWAGVENDGIYGCLTARTVADWQWRVGAPNHAGAIPPAELLILLGYRTRPLAWINRARARKGKPNPRMPKCAVPPRGVVIRPRERWAYTDMYRYSVVNHYSGIPHVCHWFGPGVAAGNDKGEIAQVNGFLRYHLSLGWSYLGYNWVILSSGLILEGRGRNIRGAHSGHNLANTYPGVLVMCGSGKPRPTDAALESLQLMRKQEKWGRRYGHLEFYSTSCPGPVLMPWIRTHR